MRIVGILLLLLVGVMVWQNFRYLQIRRDIVRDQQPLVYPGESFHAVTFLEVEEGSDVVEEVGKLKRVLESSGEANVVYAGQAALVPLESSQLGPASWNAVVLVSYPSREVFDRISTNATTRDALASFPRHYTHGMKRPVLTNLLLPQVLLGLRVLDIAKGNWSVAELEPMPIPPGSEQQAAVFKDRVEKFLRLEEVNEEAVVVFNLVLRGNEKEREANRSYGRLMLTRMASLAHGPMHFASAVTVEGDARFEEIAIVYYPGVDYFTRMIGSRFFQGIVGGKQLGDTMAVPTVPILDKLQ